MPWTTQTTSKQSKEEQNAFLCSVQVQGGCDLTLYPL